MNMKSGIVAAVAACALAAGAAEVKKPSIMPSWSGAKIATWTMDYEAALESAKADGKYTILMFSGMWWCPHCQFLEENVLKTSGWKSYAKANGLYETVLDFPNRAGDGYWCWLWESSFRKKAKLTAEEAAGELAARYDVQNAYSVQPATRQTAKNMVVEGKYGASTMTPYEEKPTSEYTRVGYPTMIVLDPNGQEVGRFTPVKSDEEYAADPLAWVKAKVNAMLHPGAGEMITQAGQYSGSYVDANGALAGTVTCKAAKPNKDTNFATLTFSFAATSGKKTAVKASVYSAEGEKVSVTDKSGNVLAFTLTSDAIAGTYNGQAFRVLRDVFAEDAEAATRLGEVDGTWSLVVSGSFDYEKGCRECGTYEEGTANRALLTVSIGAKGKTKVSGTTSAGTKVSVTAQLSYDSTGELYLPITDKKSGMALVLRIDAKDQAQVVHPANGEKLVAWGRPAETLVEPLYFSCEDGTAAKLTVAGTKLKASAIGLTLSYTSKTGACKGSYKDGSSSVSVNGVFAGSTGYLTATPRGGDPLEALVSSVRPKDLPEDCDDCHD